MRTLNVTIKIEDNDFVEHSLRKELTKLLGQSIIDIKTLPRTKHLRENKVYLDLKKGEKEAKNAVYDFINKTTNSDIVTPAERAEVHKNIYSKKQFLKCTNK